MAVLYCRLPIFRDPSNWFAERHVSGQQLTLDEQDQAGGSVDRANGVNSREGDREENWVSDHRVPFRIG
eukprot:2428652-Pyramimonas_sp.AAC.2